MNALTLLNLNLSDLIALPDEEAAPVLNQRMSALNLLEVMYHRSYGDRTVIIREFERRKLWQKLIDPDTGTHFSSLTAWLSCSDYLGCRRVNFEALKTGKLLADVPAEKLIDVPKGNLHVLTQLSTQVRNDPTILEAAKKLPEKQFLEKLEKEQPDQHVEVKSDFRFSPGRSGAKVIEQWIAYAIEHDIAGSETEAIVRACEVALHDAELDEELKAMPAEDFDRDAHEHGKVPA